MGKAVKKDNRGGKREGSGRKSTLEPGEKRIPLFIYPKANEVELLGGKEAVKALSEAHVTKLAKNKK